MIIDIKDTDFQQNTDRLSAIAFGGKKACVLTFGCQQNEADSEKARGILKTLGYGLTTDFSDADLILVNTCAIRAHAEDKALSLLGNFRSLKRKNPNLIIGLMGCMAAEETVVNKIKTDFPYVTFTLEPNMLHKLPELVLRYTEDSKRGFIYGQDSGDIVEGLPIERVKTKSAWVSIMYGCNNFCSYCIVPYVRGRERSRRSIDVINECKSLILAGAKEITLLGQNVNSYKSDITFPQLLKAIAEIDGDFIIRFMTSHPKDVSDELIAVMKEYTPKVAPYFHLPLQSGSDPILKAMNRTYNKERFISVARALLENVPGIALSTDVIIGFPGETDEDFENTLDVLRQVRFDMVYSFNYSPRVGTKAAKMENTVSDDVKDKRMKELLDLQDVISYERNLDYVGRRERILVEGVSKKNSSVYSGRTLSNKLVHFSSENNHVGEFIDVVIEKAGAFDLFAREIQI